MKLIIGIFVVIESVILSYMWLIISPPDSTSANEITQSTSSQHALSTEEENNLEDLKVDIETYLATQPGSYSVYIEDLNTGESLSVNGEELYPPASIFKVPFAMLVVQDIERGNVSFETVLTLQDYHKMYATDVLAGYPAGSQFTVRNLIDRMLTYSDNTALNILYNHLYIEVDINARLQKDLNLRQTTLSPYQTTSTDIGHVFKDLYLAQILSKQNSEFILALLTNNPFYKNTRIDAGLPQDVSLAHKIGNLDTTCQDAGIVYSSTGDYIIVILNQYVSYTAADNTMSEVSRMTYRHFEKPKTRNPF